MHDPTMKLQPFSSQEGVSTACDPTLVPVVHVCVDVYIVVSFRHKLFTAVCIRTKHINKVKNTEFFLCVCV